MTFDYQSEDEMMIQMHAICVTTLVEVIKRSNKVQDERNGIYFGEKIFASGLTKPSIVESKKFT